jgi:serine/threonine protein kinase
MAKVIAIGTPVNDDERRAIAHLRSHLPDAYFILHNFELVYDRQAFEIDIAVLAPHALYLVDVKGTRGSIEVAGGKWYPEGRQPFPSPLSKLRGHARSLKGFLLQRHPGRREIEDIYVDAVVILSGQSVQLSDRTNADKPSTQVLAKCHELFLSTARLPPGRAKPISSLHGQILGAIQGISKASKPQPIIGEWKVMERLGGNDHYEEFRAVHATMSQIRTAVRIRSFKADPYLDEAERKEQELLISTAYRALMSMPVHQNIIGAKSFIPSDVGDRFHLVTEEVVGQSLRLHIDKPQLAMTLEQKGRVVLGILQALVHMQSHRVVHRNLSPANILVGPDNQPRITGFDFARPGTGSQSIAKLIDEGDLEVDYMAPELVGNPKEAAVASDLFSAGIIFYELFVGTRPFSSQSDLYNCNAHFTQAPSALQSNLPKTFDTWLQSICTFDPKKRPIAQDALTAWTQIWEAKPETSLTVAPPTVQMDKQQFYKNLNQGHALTQKFVVEEKLGQGGYGTVYRVTDTLGDISRVVKIIHHDRSSTIERVKKEYRALLDLRHPHVVQVIDADWLADGTPYLVFEYVEGRDLKVMLEKGEVGVEDLPQIAREALEGLKYLHQQGLWHCDIKPSNILWTQKGTKLIDFNVSVKATDDTLKGGGTRRYVPPDFDPSITPTPDSLLDRDLFALGVTLFEVASGGRYPWGDALAPTPQAPTVQLQDMPRCSDLAPDLLEALRKALAPLRSQRYSSAEEFLSAILRVTLIRKPRTPTTPDLGSVEKNTNPFVNFLSTCFSQSHHTNAGTRGKDRRENHGLDLWVETDLERHLLPAIIRGEFSLVIISGNAGDGKTTFLQRLEEIITDEGGRILSRGQNGVRFSLRGRSFVSNYDGSQDEGNKDNNAVLETFFAPFQGKFSQWKSTEVHLIAINEGRLVDYLEENHQRYADLYRQVHQGLNGNPVQSGLAIVNLNLRSLVVDPMERDDSLFDRLLGRMTHDQFWEPCTQCDLADKCYAHQNAKTLQDSQAGNKVKERLRYLYTLVHLRGRLHVTMRDLRSALAYMLGSGRTCAEIHALYNESGRRREILESWYYNSWMGSGSSTGDRLLTELSGLDMAHADDPRLDRGLDFGKPIERPWLFSFPSRSKYDWELLTREYVELENVSMDVTMLRVTAHRQYVGWLRRKAFFERRDTAWTSMVAYQHAQIFLKLLRGELAAGPTVQRQILASMLHGEGITHPEHLPNHLALEVRKIDGAALRSYRVFPGYQFKLQRIEVLGGFVEQLPTHLLLVHDKGSSPEHLQITLDIYEILMRREAGYRASQEEEQGFALQLEIFKNMLLSAPSQELWLTKDGKVFYSMVRQPTGNLQLSQVENP